MIPSTEAHRETQPTLGFQRVLQRAVFHVQSAEEEVTGANVLAAIFSEQESQAVYFLKQENITRLDVVNFISHGISKVEERREMDDPDLEQPLEQENTHESVGKSPLECYAINLNVLAKQGKIDPLIGRTLELERTVQILCRRRKNNPLFVGEAGVGKTAIAEGLAKAILEGKVPKALHHCTVYAHSVATVLAGTKYRGDFKNALNRYFNTYVKI